jgi:uracil phosphoribosyltransferase
MNNISKPHFIISELSHKYGGNIHILYDPYHLTHLANFSCPATIQPELNFLLKTMYKGLLRTVLNMEFPMTRKKVCTRMDAEYEGYFLAEDTEVVTVDIARAGITPSMVCFEVLSHLLAPGRVRQDHIIMQRIVSKDGRVEGAQISGTKIGGSVQDRIMLFPDPMGATGSTLCEILHLYQNMAKGTPAKIISLNLIITPEFIRKVKSCFPDVKIYAFRVDRGLSSPRALSALPGEFPSEERGLNDHHYIIPGAGGLGEVLNNAVE